MYPALLLPALVLAAPPDAEPASPPLGERVEIRYTLSYDLPAMADRLCGMSGLCDCSARFHGEGELLEQEGQRWTYQGSWVVEESDCSEDFHTWVPADGRAFHTLRMTEAGRLSEWVAHGEREDRQRLSSDIKAGGQVWLAEMDAAPTGQPPVLRHEEQETGSASGLSITTRHKLEIRGGDSPTAPTPSPAP